jgi:hypothetical protein
MSLFYHLSVLLRGYEQVASPRLTQASECDVHFQIYNR